MVNVLLNALTLVPVLVPFLQSHGLSLHQVFLLQGLYSFSWVVADIPTGYLADTWGRKNTLATSAFFFCLTGIGYVAGSEFWHFCIVSILLGIAVGLSSGTIEALTYDTLLETGDERSYRRICGYQNISGWVSVAVSGIIGGFIASYSLRLAAAIMIPLFAMGFFVTLNIVEPRRNKTRNGAHLQNMLRICTDTFNSPTLRSIILLFSLISAMTFSLVWFTQPYQSAVHLPLSIFGIANAIFMLGLIGATQCSHYFEKHLDDRILLLSVAIIALLSFFALGLPVSFFGLLFLLIGRSTFGALNPLTADMINQVTTSDRRATVLSLRTFTYNLIFSIASPLLGAIAGAYSLNEAILLVGIVGGAFALPVSVLLIKTWEKLPARA